MKAITLTVAMSLAVVIGAAGQTSEVKAPTVRCTQANGSACTAAHVQNLASAVKAAAKGSKPVLANVKALSLAGTDGTLKCRQNSGKACTMEQAQALHDVSAAMPITLSLN